MQTEIIPFTDKESWLKNRIQDITSTDVSALFGVSPHLTEFELWHRKRNKLTVEIKPNERMKWGNRFENPIAIGIAEDEGWEIRKMNEYIRVPTLRIGSSFDYEILEPMGLLEIKNVGLDQYKKEDQWILGADGNLQAPLHIELQVQHQMLVSQCPTAFIGALIGGNQVKLIKRIADKKVHDAILSMVEKFWKSIDSNTPPPPEFARDADFIQKLFNYAEPGKVFDARNDDRINELMKEYSELNLNSKLMNDRKDEIKAEILMKIADAEKVIGEGFSISAGVRAPTEVPAHTRAGFRAFTPYFKKK